MPVFTRRRRTKLNSTVSEREFPSDNKVEMLDPELAPAGLGMRRNVSSGSLLQFRKRNESTSSIGSNFSGAGSWSKWHRLDNPLFSTSILLRPKSSERNNRKKTERIQRKNEKQLAKVEKRRGKLNKDRSPEDNLTLLEKEASKLKTTRSRSFIRRRKTNKKEDKKNVDLLNMFEERVDEDEEQDSENTYNLYTKKGESAKVHFGHDYLSINGNLILYEHVIYWGYTKTCLKVSYVENMSTSEQDRIDLALYPIENKDERYSKSLSKKAVKPKDLADILQTKVASLLSELTGCSKDEALDKSSKRASKHEVNDVLDQVDESTEKCLATGYTKDL